MPERIVTVYRFESSGASPAGRARAAIAIECASGTYVRSLIADLGDALLPRAAAHRDRPFDVRDAVRRRLAARPGAIPALSSERAPAMLHGACGRATARSTAPRAMRGRAARIRLCGREGHTSCPTSSADDAAQRRGRGPSTASISATAR